MSDNVSHAPNMLTDMHEAPTSQLASAEAYRPYTPRRVPRSHMMNFASMLSFSLLLTVAMLLPGAAGFAPRAAQRYFRYRQHELECQTRQCSSTVYMLLDRRKRTPYTTLCMSSAAVAAAGTPSRGGMSNFEKRMRNIVVNDRIRSKEATLGGRNGRPSNVKVVHTLGDYKVVVGDERDKVVVVRFYATWCKVRSLRHVCIYFSSRNLQCWIWYIWVLSLLVNQYFRIIWWWVAK